MAFVKGKSGNPSGRPKVDPEIKALLDACTPDAINTLVEIMRDKTAQASPRVTAALGLLRKTLPDQVATDHTTQGESFNALRWLSSPGSQITSAREAYRRSQELSRNTPRTYSRSEEGGEFDLRLGVPGLHTIAQKVQFVERKTILPPELIRRLENQCFWRDKTANPSDAAVLVPSGQAHNGRDQNVNPEEESRLTAQRSVS
jgi:hypothetical protein